MEQNSVKDKTIFKKLLLYILGSKKNSNTILTVKLSWQKLMELFYSITARFDGILTDLLKRWLLISLSSKVRGRSKVHINQKNCARVL